MAEPCIRPIAEVAASLGIPPDRLVPYGADKAKLAPGAFDPASRRGRLVLVSAMTPTDAGEGKTTTSIGLAQGLARLGERACLALREPSLGPTFGMKGGATGGGKARLVPSDDVNLHFTGDFHAVTAAHNLLAAMLDNHVHHGNALGIDPRRVFWRRVLDVNDRSLRHVVIGLGGVLEGVPRETGFDITPASEVMAALCLAEDAEDLRRRLSRVVVALTFDRRPVTAADLKATGAMLALLKDALLPNLVQTGEGVPALVHGGPFANIAHGCSSVIATKAALATADWAVTEAGFGFDLGAEKFFDIKCVSAGLDTAAVVLVATVRALKRHGGVGKDALGAPDPAAVERGLSNLAKHVESIRDFGETPVVALNRFASDAGDEVDVVRRASEGWGAPFAVTDAFARGGEGATELAEAVLAHAEKRSRPFRPLYDWKAPVKEKMAAIARHMYGAHDVAYTREAERDLAEVRRLGHEGLPLCVAKTQMSLSDDPKLVGRPADFHVTVRGVLLAAGAGYLVPLLGDILRMPGLPASPQAERIDLVDGKIVGIH
ncbi:MAG: formate--tetrahydrofolate ligase [Acidobacteria bacterium]|nr:MAG: formate--tetrahydrofolate ligase [Acidobacteriota bacterium]MCE7959576.1 formate--tetrahydrofolate ligase [Acidobacteria bacterium ACB2]